jgi:hypothetical protein
VTSPTAGCVLRSKFPEIPDVVSGAVPSSNGAVAAESAALPRDGVTLGTVITVTVEAETSSGRVLRGGNSVPSVVRFADNTVLGAEMVATAREEVSE